MGRRTANMGRMRMGSTVGMEALGSPWEWVLVVSPPVRLQEEK